MEERSAHESACLLEATLAGRQVIRVLSLNRDHVHVRGLWVWPSLLLRLDHPLSLYLLSLALGALDPYLDAQRQHRRRRLRDRVQLLPDP